MSERTPSHNTPEQAATEPVNPAVRFERQDTRIRPIFLTAAALVVLSVLAHLISTWLYAAMTRGAPAGPMQPLIGQDRLRLPRDLQKVPSPRLQVNQERELATLHAEEEEFLGNKKQPFGWVEKDKVLRTPIGYAVQLLSDPKTAEALGIHVRPVAKEAGQAGRAKQ